MIENRRTIVVHDGDPTDAAELRVVVKTRTERDEDDHGRVVELHTSAAVYVTLSDLDELATALRELHDEIAGDS